MSAYFTILRQATQPDVPVEIRGNYRSPCNSAAEFGEFLFRLRTLHDQTRTAAYIFAALDGRRGCQTRARSKQTPPSLDRGRPEATANYIGSHPYMASSGDNDVAVRPVTSFAWGPIPSWGPITAHARRARLDNCHYAAGRCSPSGGSAPVRRIGVSVRRRTRPYLLCVNPPLRESTERPHLYAPSSTPQLPLRVAAAAVIN